MGNFLVGKWPSAAQDLLYYPAVMLTYKKRSILGIIMWSGCQHEKLLTSRRSIGEFCVAKISGWFPYPLPSNDYVAL